SPPCSSISTMSPPFWLLSANRLRTFDNPPRLSTAAASPPPGPATSPRKRNRSSRLDLPDALGPTMNNRSSRGKSRDLKLRQLLALTCVTRIVAPRFQPKPDKFTIRIGGGRTGSVPPFLRCPIEASPPQQRPLPALHRPPDGSARMGVQ